MTFNQLSQFLNRAMAPMKRKVQLMVGRAILTTINDSKNIQEVQVSVLADEVQDDVQSFQTYGFRSRPPVGSEGILLSVGGNRENAVVIATENREAKDTLPALEEGESVWYHHKEEVFLQWKGKNLEGKVGKIKIENDSEELIQVLFDWITQHIANKNITAIGPQPLFPADIVLMEALKAKLETFKT